MLIVSRDVSLSRAGKYTPNLDKEVSPISSDAELAYRVLAEAIDTEFGDSPVSVNEIYEKITYPKFGLTRRETLELVQRAARKNYLIKA